MIIVYIVYCVYVGYTFLSTYEEITGSMVKINWQQCKKIIVVSRRKSNSNITESYLSISADDSTLIPTGKRHGFKAAVAQLQVLQKAT